jgi:hypothetical protein
MDLAEAWRLHAIKIKQSACVGWINHRMRFLNLTIRTGKQNKEEGCSKNFDSRG